MKKCFLLPCVIVVILVCCSCSDSTEKVVIENDLIAKTFSAHRTKAGPILVEVVSKKDDASVIKSSHQPYFEFVLDHKKVGSNDEVWILKATSDRSMDNGGTEHTIIFEGVKDPVAGLQVKVLQQSFPGSTLMREKLVLLTESESFALHKLDNKLHFRFPAYSIPKPKGVRAMATEIRIATFEKKPITFGDDQHGNHMFYPDIINYELTEVGLSVKGPVAITTTADLSWFTAYEHASQDDLKGMFDDAHAQGSGGLINDAMQGTKGVFNFPMTEDDLKFIGINSQLSNHAINISVDLLRGAYLDGELIEPEHPYSTVWTATGFYQGQDLTDGKAMLRNYLLNQICENPVSRVPEFYYNTWGLQRNDQSKPLRDILTYDRIFEEIDYAAELGVDIFVLDDGWENAQGEWYPNQLRLTEGLAPIKEKLDALGIKMGLWYSPMGIDSTTKRYQERQEWVVRDSDGNPILAQWDHPAFDFVSGFFDVFVDDCKQMIDAGCRFMKWDAINTFYSSLANLHHGSEAYSEKEVRARYEYLLPIYVVRAMEILTDYEPELIIEIDVTEARRVMTGLAPLSQGKFFWMNNGASWYNDYTTFRTQSMRTIANEFAGLIPLELFTYANYPHNLAGSMKYNVHNSLLAGHGFWGNLQLMTTEEREWVGAQVVQSKRVLPYLVEINPKVTGAVGDSPEIYAIINKEEAAGQVIAFTTDPVQSDVTLDVNLESMLVALNNPFSTSKNHLTIPIDLEDKKSSIAVIVIPNDGNKISITSSTSVISDAIIDDNILIYQVASPGTQTIVFEKESSEPIVAGSRQVSSTISKSEGQYKIKVVTEEADCKVSVKF